MLHHDRGRPAPDVGGAILSLRGTEPLDDVRRLSYSEIFTEFTGLDALDFSFSRYFDCAKKHNLHDAGAICGDNHSLWLDFLFSHIVQPRLIGPFVYLIYNYPACQAGLARLCTENKQLAERVELFINGVELGNGYYELSDAVEQEQRFTAENAIREQRSQPVVTADRRLLAALSSGLPDCAGMAIGLDRLLMLATGSRSIDEVLAFSVASA